MKRNDDFLLTQFDNEYFLVPTGQAAADHRRTLSLNEVGVFLWNCLAKDIPMEHLINLTVREYAANPEDIPRFTEDVYAFVDVLRAKGLIVEDAVPGQDFTQHNSIIKIAGIKIKIDAGDDILSDKFAPWLVTDDGPVGMTFTVKFGLPRITVNGNVLIRTKEVLIMETKEEYVLVYSSFKQVKEIRINHALNEVVVFAVPPVNDEMKEEIYLSLRTPFLMKALEKGMIMLHSASLVYKNKLYCFTGPSGTGKSTHTNLWKSLLDVHLVNGDLNLLAPGEEKTFVYGTPWCGTSGISDSEIYTLGGIVFLSQAPVNSARALNKATAYRMLISRITTPTPQKDFSEKLFSLCSEVIGNTPCFSLECTPDEGAMYAIKEKMDSIE